MAFSARQILSRCTTAVHFIHIADVQGLWVNQVHVRRAPDVSLLIRPRVDRTAVANELEERGSPSSWTDHSYRRCSRGMIIA